MEKPYCLLERNIKINFKHLKNIENKKVRIRNKACTVNAKVFYVFKMRKQKSDKKIFYFSRFIWLLR